MNIEYFFLVSREWRETAPCHTCAKSGIYNPFQTILMWKKHNSHASNIQECENRMDLLTLSADCVLFQDNLFKK